MEQLERVNSAMSNLATDNDRDVAAEARAINDLFKRTPVSFCPAAATPCCCLYAHTHFSYRMPQTTIEGHDLSGPFLMHHELNSIHALLDVMCPTSVCII